MQARLCETSGMSNGKLRRMAVPGKALGRSSHLFLSRHRRIRKTLRVELCTPPDETGNRPPDDCGEMSGIGGNDQHPRGQGYSHLGTDGEGGGKRARRLRGDNWTRRRTAIAL